MAMQHDKINWSEAEAKADSMTTAQLWSEIHGLREVLESADNLDRSDEGNRGGYYRDLISVYANELRKGGWTLHI